jgi:hypothetical protein
MQQLPMAPMHAAHDSCSFFFLDRRIYLDREREREGREMIERELIERERAMRLLMRDGDGEREERESAREGLLTVPSGVLGTGEVSICRRVSI